MDEVYQAMVPQYIALGAIYKPRTFHIVIPFLRYVMKFWKPIITCVHQTELFESIYWCMYMHQNRISFCHRLLDSYDFWYDRSWILPWIKSISNELDIIIHVIMSQWTICRHLWARYVVWETKWCVYSWRFVYAFTSVLLVFINKYQNNNLVSA